MLEIIMDSASDTPLEVKEYYHPHVMSTLVVIDGEDYLDGGTIRPFGFYEIQRKGKRETSTYHINPDTSEEAFRRYAETRVSVLCVCLSTGIAATQNVAHVARENLLEKYPEFDLSTVDSRRTSAGSRLLAHYLLRLREKRADREMLLEATEYCREHIRHVFMVDILEYLIRGGRITRGRGMVAETLSIRPMTTMDERGSLKALRLVRGTKKIYRALAKYVAERGAGFENQSVAFYHRTVLEAVEKLMGIMKSIGVGAKRPVVSQVGYAIEAHTGERIVGICFLDVINRYGAFGEVAGGV